MPPRFALTSLMLGNFAVGLAVLAPAGMILELSRGLSVTVRDAGFLITAGAVVLCFASPISAWLTSRFDRRLLLAASLFVLAVGHLVSALAPDYYSLLAARVLMLAVDRVHRDESRQHFREIVDERRVGDAEVFNECVFGQTAEEAAEGMIGAVMMHVPDLQERGVGSSLNESAQL